MKIRNILYADKGMILTDGTKYGSIIYLEEGVPASAYYEITENTYNNIMEAALLEGDSTPKIDDSLTFVEDEATDSEVSF